MAEQVPAGVANAPTPEAARGLPVRVDTQARPKESSPKNESLRPSGRLMWHIAHGEFDSGQFNPTKTTNTVSEKSYQALQAQHENARNADSHLRKDQVREWLRGKISGIQDSDMTPKLLHHAEMEIWAKGEAQTIANMLRQGDNRTAEALQKLGFTIPADVHDPHFDQAFKNALYTSTTDTTGEYGSFYAAFCRNGIDTNKLLAEKLSPTEIDALHPFLRDILGGEPAFQALKVLKQTVDTLPTMDAQQQAATYTNEPTLRNETEQEVFDHFKKGAEIARRKAEAAQQAAASPDNHDAQPPVPQPEQQPSPSSPERPQTAEDLRREVFENAGTRSPEEVSKLIGEVQDILTQEKEAGRGKMKATIQEMNDSQDIDQAIPTREGEVVFLPKEAGRLVTLGDIHGDLATIQQVLTKEHVLEDLVAGNPVQVVFMGDLVDRGPKDIEVMEAVMMLKKLYPDNITIMKADHETAGGIRPHEFPSRLQNKFGQEKGTTLNDEYINLFYSLPRFIACANGLDVVHGGPSSQLLDLHELATLSPQEVGHIMDREITWADPADGRKADNLRTQKENMIRDLQDQINNNNTVPYFEPPSDPARGASGAPALTTIEQKRDLLHLLTTLPPGFYPHPERSSQGTVLSALTESTLYYTGEAVTASTQKTGSTAMLRAHQTSEQAGENAIKFGGKLGSIHTTGAGSPESVFSGEEPHPRYAVFDLAKPITQISPDNIKDVWTAETTAQIPIQPFREKQGVLASEQTVNNIERIIAQLNAPGLNRLGKEITITQPVIDQIQTFVQETKNLLQQNQEFQRLLSMINGQLDRKGEFGASIFGGNGVVPNEEINTPKVIRLNDGQVQIQVPPTLFGLFKAYRLIDNPQEYIDQYQATINSGGAGLSGFNFAKDLSTILPAYIQLQPAEVRARLSRPTSETTNASAEKSPFEQLAIAPEIAQKALDQFIKEGEHYTEVKGMENGVGYVTVDGVEYAIKTPKNSLTGARRDLVKRRLEGKMQLMKAHGYYDFAPVQILERTNKAGETELYFVQRKLEQPGMPSNGNPPPVSSPEKILGVLQEKGLDITDPKGNFMLYRDPVTNESRWVLIDFTMVKELTSSPTPEKIRELAHQAFEYMHNAQNNPPETGSVFEQMGDPGNRALSNAIDKIPADTGQHFESHGIARGTTRDQLQALVNLLGGQGFSTIKSTTVPLSSDNSYQRPYTSGGFIIIGPKDIDMVGQDGTLNIKMVAVNEQFYHAIPTLQQWFPNVQFIKADDLPEIVKQQVEGKDSSSLPESKNIVDQVQDLADSLKTQSGKLGREMFLEESQIAASLNIVDQMLADLKDNARFQAFSNFLNTEKHRDKGVELAVTWGGRIAINSTLTEARIVRIPPNKIELQMPPDLFILMKAEAYANNVKTMISGYEAYMKATPEERQRKRMGAYTNKNFSGALNGVIAGFKLLNGYLQPGEIQAVAASLETPSAGKLIPQEVQPVRTFNG